MCGLAGWWGLSLPDKEQQEELLRLLLRKAQVRGTDSFGVAFARAGRMRVHRGLGPVSQWLSRDRTRVVRVARSNIVIGHTRAASRGAVTLTNAHPFVVGDYVGAHNGTIMNSASLMLGARHVPRGETDSEEAMAWLVTEGLSVEAFRQLQGMYAWTIASLEASEFLIAVDQRTPFAFARVGDAVIWHSLAVALETSLDAVGLRATVEEVKGRILRLPGGEVEELAPTSSAAAREPVARKEDSRMADGVTQQMEWEGWDA